jgi:hypothetical protein
VLQDEVLQRSKAAIQRLLRTLITGAPLQIVEDVLRLTTEPQWAPLSVERRMTVHLAFVVVA